MRKFVGVVLHTVADRLIVNWIEVCVIFASGILQALEQVLYSMHLKCG